MTTKRKSAPPTPTELYWVVRIPRRLEWDVKRAAVAAGMSPHVWVSVALEAALAATGHKSEEKR